MWADGGLPAELKPANIFTAGEFATGRTYLQQGVLDTIKADGVRAWERYTHPVSPPLGMPQVKYLETQGARTNLDGRPIPVQTKITEGYYAARDELPVRKESCHWWNSYCPDWWWCVRAPTYAGSEVANWW